MVVNKTTFSNADYSENCQNFLNACSELSHSDKIPSDALYGYILCQIKLWNLYNVDISDVFTEATIRGVVKITQKLEPIDNPRAWLRITAVNILREEARAISQENQLTDKDLDKYEISQPEYKDTLNEAPEKALKAFQSLSKSDKRIIAYRLIQKMRYCEIQRLSAYENVEIATLRKQYSRAIKHLKAAFKHL
jgi:DNA-directed RNA polymerase specialized sigma24 family protein